MSHAPRHTLDQLLVLEAIATHGSFAAAARSLHRVPSAVTYAIQSLEGAVGVALFDRSGHRAVLTDAGRRVLEEGAGVLQAARRLDATAQSLHAGWEPQLHVVVDGALPLAPMLSALRQFIDAGTPTRVRLDVEYQEGVSEVFTRREADLMVVLEFDATGALEAEPLAPFDMVLLAAPSHPLMALDEPTRRDLDEYVEIVVKDSASRFGEDPREAWFGAAHVLYLSDFHAKREALHAGLGFGWMPEHLVETDLAEGTLRPLCLPDGHRWTYHPKLARASARPLGRGGRLMWDLVRQSFGP